VLQCPQYYEEGADVKPDTDRIAALVKQDLYEQFGSLYKFAPVIAERRIHYGYDETEEYYAVWVGYDPKPEPDPKVTNGISRRIRKGFWEMGLTRVATRLIPADQFETAREMAGDGTL